MQDGSRLRWTTETFLSVIPGPLHRSALVLEQLAVHGVGHVPLERTDGVLLRLALGDLAVEVGAALGVQAADLAHSGDVQGVFSLRFPR